MMTELNANDRARLRAQVIDEGLSRAIAAHLRGAPRADLRQAVATAVSDAKRTMTPPQDVIASLKAHIQRDAQPHRRATFGQRAQRHRRMRCRADVAQQRDVGGHAISNAHQCA